MMVTEVNDGLSDHMMEIATFRRSLRMHGGDRCHIKIVLAISYRTISAASYAIVAFYALSLAFYVVCLI